MATNTKQNRMNAFQRYLDLSLVIRDLSSPQIANSHSPETYRRTLLRNFCNIGAIAQENSDILTRHWLPLIEKAAPLSVREANDLRAFSDLLLNNHDMENMDLPVIYRQGQRLLAHARENGDDASLVRILDHMVDVTFIMMHITQRLSPVNDIMFRYRDEGIACAEEIISYLEPSRFVTLPDDVKRHVLVVSRYIATLFEREDTCGNEDINDRDLAILDRSLALADNPFFLEHAPADYSWLNHTFRTLQYTVNQIERGNPHGFNKRQLSHINERAKQMHALWYNNHDALQEYSIDVMIDFPVLRASFLAGETDPAAYANGLMEIFDRCSESDYSFRTAKTRLMITLEYLLALDKNRLTPQNEADLDRLYRSLVGYVHRMPKKGSMSFILTLLMYIIKAFIEVPGGMDFETFCLSLIASLHPPTYVHSLTVAEIAKCLTKHLLALDPSLFTGVCGCKTEDEVSERADDILYFAYHAALCHDFGKLFISEVIMSYGRSLLPEEFHLVHTHPEIGAYILSGQPSTAPYANVARFHHKWYNDRGGYPAGAEKKTLPEEHIIDIISCADCLDASTDVVGRSYKAGKSPDDFFEELRRDGGVRYAPFLIPLLEQAEVREDIEKLLSAGRNENYRRAYEILSRV